MDSRQLLAYAALLLLVTILAAAYLYATRERRLHRRSQRRSMRFVRERRAERDG